MKRLTFLKLLFNTGLISLVPVSFLSKKKKTKLMSCTVAGFQFYQGPELIHQLKSQDSLNLRREPENPHDEYAIAVYYGNNKIGFIPRDMNHLLARIIDHRLLDVEAEIKKTSASSNFPSVTIEIFTSQHQIRTV